MSDPLDRDRFPDRPTSPDFWPLSEVVLQQDGALEDRTAEEHIRLFIDPDVLGYFAHHRTTEGMQRMGVPPSIQVIMGSAIAGTWIDGFMAGAAFERRYGGKRGD